ncbi:MAG: prepilin-type N-terminal cleavage/methylation domain-containing protein [Gammaproteobacteria bacterium]|jgi:general secretion pathway protein I|nr:prepilin-type N-terminal cleavage/methylation domain-containing protein [Gammaproteobacteria bacterium]
MSLAGHDDPDRARFPVAACRRSRQAGFTLIEVMAAFMVFSLLFGVVLQILSTSVGNTRMSGDYTQAALWAQSRLDTVGLESMIEPGVTRGDFDDRFSWTMEVEETAVADGRGLDAQEGLPIVLYHIRLTVEWGEGNRGRQAVFETMRSVDTHWQERQRGRQ